MRNYRFGFVVVIFAVILGLLLPGFTGFAQSDDDPVIIRIAPGDIEVPPGEVTQVAVEIKDARDLYGFEVKLTFDPNTIEIIDANPNQDGVQISQGTFFDSGFVLRNTADNETGTLNFAMTQLNPSEAKSGEGILLVIQVRGRQPAASSTLTFTQADVAQRDGTKLPTEPEAGSVHVLSDGTAVPSPTPIPTQVPGTPLSALAPTPTPRNTPTPRPSPTVTPTATSTPTASPTATSSPTATPTATEQASPAVATETETATPAAIAAVPQDENGSGSSDNAVPINPQSASSAGEQSPGNVLLLLGIGMLALAAVLGVAAVLVWRRSAA